AFVVVLAADELVYRVRRQILRELPGRALRRGAAQRRRSRRPRLAALFAQVLVPSNGHDVGRKTGLLAHRLHRGGVHALPHFGVAVENLQSRIGEDVNRDVAAFDRTVAEAGALDAAANPFVLRALVDASDGVQRLADAANALAHDLARAERVAGVEDVPLADVPAVDAHALRQDVHHAFDRELRLIAAEAAHRAGVRIVGVHRLGFDVDAGNPVGAARVARGAKRALGARRVIAAGIGHDPRSQREQAPFGIGADRERDRHRMALHVVLRRLLAGEHGLDGPLQKVRGYRRLSLNRQLLFRAERAAACRQNDLDVSGIQV